MFFIVSHHYVVNSGLLSQTGEVFQRPFSFLSLFYVFFGAWGKIGINGFVLITGYFMVKSNINFKKFLKLFLEFMFYKIVIGVIFLFSGYVSFSWAYFLKLFIPILSVGRNFTSCFFLFYWFIPFLNILLSNITEKQHIYLIVLCFVVYVFFGTFRVLEMNYISWFMVLYFISAYIRLYPKSFFNTKICTLMFALSLFLSGISLLFCLWFTPRMFGKISPYLLVTDSNSFLAVFTGVSSFLFFRSLNVKYSRMINSVSRTTFGILLIHANSDVMRDWLWKNLLDVVGHYNKPFYAIVCVISVFFVCSIIDYIRIKCIEIPFFNCLNRMFRFASKT